MDDAIVEILINAKNMAGPAIEQAKIWLEDLKDILGQLSGKELEATGFAKNFKEVIDSLNRSTASGVDVNVAAREALASYSRGLLEGSLTAREQKDAIQDMRQALTRYIEVVSAGMAPQDAQAAIIAMQTEAMRRNTDAVKDNVKAKAEANALSTIMGGIGGGIGGAVGAVRGNLLVSGIVTALTVLEPFTALVVAATVAVAAFTAGVAAMAVVLGAASLGFLGLGAGLVLLAEKTGQITGPFNQFKADLKDLGDGLGKLAAPSASGILKFLDTLMPLAQSEGSGIIEWFNARLPGALTSLHAAINNLVPDLNGFGRFLGQVFDHVSPQIPTMFEAIAQFGIGAIQGLITNLVSLSDWFQKELPSFKPMMSDIFGAIGTGVQFVATNFGKLSDWFAKNWPTIKQHAEEAKDAFVKGWNAIPSFGGPTSTDPSQIVNEILTILGIVGHIVVDVIDAIVVITQQAFSALPAALLNIQNSLIGFINACIQIANHIPGVNLQQLGLVTDSSAVNTHTGAPRIATRGSTSVTQINHFHGNTSPQVTANTIARRLTAF